MEKTTGFLSENTQTTRKVKGFVSPNEKAKAYAATTKTKAVKTKKMTVGSIKLDVPMDVKQAFRLGILIGQTMNAKY